MEEMQQIEVMKTKTRGFRAFTDALEYILAQETNGWAVRQIISVPNKGSSIGPIIFVVLEDNR